MGIYKEDSKEPIYIKLDKDVIEDFKKILKVYNPDDSSESNDDIENK